MKKSRELELLDAEHIPKEALYQNLKELKIINTLLGGHNAVLRGYMDFYSYSNYKILEIGSGGGDNLGMLKKKFPNNIYAGLDLKQDCISYSKIQDPSINWIQENYKNHSPDSPYDIIFNSLFCHHFSDFEITEMLVWMNQNSKKGFFIADLHRHPLAYVSIKILTKFFSKSYLVKNDAPLSVKRAFTRKEWVKLLESAGIRNYSIRWVWAFRFVITVYK